MSSYKRIVEAGQEVADKIAALRAETVAPSSHTPGCFNSESLVAFQVRVSNAGFIEAEIVESIYGYSLRYASGLQNFGLIYSARQGELDGTLEHAVARAREWQSRDPTKRYVTRGVKGD